MLHCIHTYTSLPIQQSHLIIVNTATERLTIVKLCFLPTSAYNPSYQSSHVILYKHIRNTLTYLLTYIHQTNTVSVCILTFHRLTVALSRISSANRIGVARFSGIVARTVRSCRLISCRTWCSNVLLNSSILPISSSTITGCRATLSPPLHTQSSDINDSWCCRQWTIQQNCQTITSCLTHTTTTTIHRITEL